MEVEEEVFIKPQMFPDRFDYSLPIRFRKVMVMLAAQRWKAREDQSWNALG